MIQYEEIRKKVIETGLLIKDRLVVGTWGNISIKIPDKDLMAITPSGVDYDTIKPSHIVIMDFNGNVIDGEKKPSIEYPIHSAVYKNRSDVGALIHTHSEYATAFAMARKPIILAAEDLAQIIGGDILVASYALPGTVELSRNVVEALGDNMAVLLANHGLLCCGKDIKEAYKSSCIVEKSAKELIFAKLLGGVVPLSKEDVKYMRDFYLNKYGK